jgi:peroxiredoxin
VSVLPILAALVACSPSFEALQTAHRDSVKPAKERRPAPDFALKDENGATVRLSDYRGKVVLLNFWATWCGPCKIEIPWFVEFESKYKDQGFAVIGVSMDEGGWDDVKPYLRRVKVNYRVVIGDEEVAQKYGSVEALPTSFLIDREGLIASVHVGLVPKSDYQKSIEALLGSGSEGGRQSRRKTVLADTSQ